MNESQIEQLPGESRTAYVARITAVLEAERVGAGVARQSFNHRFLHGLQWLLVGLFRHWLLIANLFYIYILLASTLIAPWLFSRGQAAVGNWMFNTMSLICDQVPTHSYYIFGYQMCLCQRCLAIYGSMLIGGLIYSVLRRGRTIPYLQWRLLLLLSLPLVVDGFSQLFGWRESSILLRTLTGGLFGFAYVATVYPWFDLVKGKLFRVWGVQAAVPAVQGTAATHPA